MASIPIGKKNMSRLSQMILPKSAACRRVPAGCLAVYVGEERRRFVIPTRYLGLPAFAALLERSEEEFGYRSPNGLLLLPCEVSSFTALLHQLKEEDKHRKEKQKAHELLSLLFSRACKLAACLSSASPSSSNNSRSIRTPLLYKGSA